MFGRESLLILRAGRVGRENRHHSDHPISSRFHPSRHDVCIGREDGGDGEEEARRAAWQVQVQEDSKNRVEESHKVNSGRAYPRRLF